MTMKNFQFPISKADAFGRLRDSWHRGFQKKSGFTLIETLVAVSIVTLAIAGPLFTANSAIVAAENARNQLTASYLAQEGVEYVRAMRDNEYLAAFQADPITASNNAWTHFLNNNSDISAITECRALVSGPTKLCSLDPVQGAISPLFVCPGNVCTPLYLLANGIYTQQSNQGGVQQPFIRTIQAIDISASDESIVSTVSWSYHTIPYSVTVTDHLTPWQ
jgi:prepilin-type N-terminal cleavage/methylation domain-containing protein